VREEGEAARAVLVWVAEHRDDDVVARHAVDGVWPRVPGLGEEHVGLDHLLDARRRGSSATFRKWMREDRKPGTIGCQRSGP
jgi:hypothetical protein